jgi:uncharacterized membrane protein
MVYLFLEWLHVIGAAVLFGTGIGIAFFTWFAYRTAMTDKNLGLLQGVLSLTVVADFVFTAVAAIAQPLTGIGMWWMSGGDWGSKWLWTVIGVYFFVGLCWLPVVSYAIR